MLKSTYKSHKMPFHEIQFAGRLIPILSGVLGPYSSLKTRRDGHTFKLETKDEGAFADLYNFLLNGHYAPNTGAANANPMVMSGALAPQVLGVLPDGTAMVARAPTFDMGALIPSFPTPILRDVRAYRVGSTLDIPELQQHALDRLMSWGVTSENPVQVLEYLYHGPQSTKKGDKGKEKEMKRDGLVEPDEPIRSWCRVWLATKEQHQHGRANLEVIKDPSRWGADYRRLREKGGLLITDTDAAEADLRAEQIQRQSGKGKGKKKKREITAPIVVNRAIPLGRGQNIGTIGWVQPEDEEEAVVIPAGNGVGRVGIVIQP